MRFIQLFLLCVGIGAFLSCKKDEPVVEDNSVEAKTEYNVAYGNDPSQKMDIYLPENRSTSSTKLLIYIHGGGWVQGDKSEFLNFYSSFNSVLNDYAFISLNYRLCDTTANTNLFPAQEDDVTAAINFIQGKLEEWNISDKAVLCGASAGGHLSLLHAYKNNDDQFVNAVVNYFGPTDLDSLYSFSAFTTSLFDAVIGGSPAEEPGMYFSSSPVNFISSGTVPTITFHGTEDAIVSIEQSVLLQQKLDDFGVHHEYEHYEGEGHGFSSTSAIHSVGRTKDFLDVANP